MAKVLKPEEFLKLGKTLPMIDVRTPAEFEEGHIPGALNIPIFTNAERVLVGTKYKRASKDSAVLLGLELVGPKLAKFVRMAKKFAPQKEIMVHCWRGGMRSGSMAWLFETAGFKVHLLEGGYKAYRRYIRQQFTERSELVVLGGMTGSGKTEVLHEMKKQGAQILDLEGIAHHKGSVFGSLGQTDQPNNENFENLLAKVWLDLDPNRPIWVEDESKSIGSVWINDALYHRMRQTDVIKILLPKSERIKRLVQEYACFDADVLAHMISKIGKRLGGLNVKLASESLEKGDYATVADITLNYYDKAYKHGLSKREGQTIHILELEKDNPTENARKVLAYYNSLKK
ncbi:tRNA 2-selenouridine(34) synthase MnmH [Marinifilum caeruleilacunae]|uniref:tRNA 2-selenouridine(34) synthase MnmH n=1 Tax=Marinifilum caeruleilacunae TaxID=2499076 RepID=A0ABX1WUW4_9BACT|nr:tRNA 2-selenouridine(34) synthase MnmH [Marinifilum caeruleilacunae]NOU59852.1 tRNA 2-selenouridine(34) synthase MnmH [Marinifilum caeruleilacunae]